MREMGYQVARRHAQKLRLIAFALAFVVPALCLALLPLTPELVVERWLFFAESTLTATLFYGADMV